MFEKMNQFSPLTAINKLCNTIPWMGALLGFAYNLNEQRTTMSTWDSYYNSDPDLGAAFYAAVLCFLVGVFLAVILLQFAKLIQENTDAHKATSAKIPSTLYDPEQKPVSNTSYPQSASASNENSSRMPETSKNPNRGKTIQVNRSNDVMFCPMCGTEQRSNRKICVQCGTSFASEE